MSTRRMRRKTAKSTNSSTDGGAPQGEARERALLASVAARDREAMAELYRLYHSRLFKFAFRMSRSHATADELVNDIMLTVWRKADSFAGRSKVSTWVLGIAYRQTLRRITRKQISIASEVELDELPGEERVNLERRDWIMAGLDRLPAAQQLTVLLVFYIGLSYEEIADISGCPVNTVKTRMFHARRKLKAYLGQTGRA